MRCTDLSGDGDGALRFIGAEQVEVVHEAAKLGLLAGSANAKEICKSVTRECDAYMYISARDIKRQATYRCKCLKKWLKLKSKSVGWVLSERFEKEEKKACDSNEAASRLSTDTLSAAHRETIQTTTLFIGREEREPPHTVTKHFLHKTCRMRIGIGKIICFLLSNNLLGDFIELLG
jgi:hypothetical protein